MVNIKYLPIMQCVFGCASVVVEIALLICKQAYQEVRLLRTLDSRTKMAKYLKSLFTPNEKKKRTIVYEADLEDGDPPLDSRRKLSISRSGRLKQANKKRHSLTMELYGENYQPAERPKTVEYHVNHPAKPEVQTNVTDRRRSVDDKVLEAEKSRTLRPSEGDRRPSTDTGILETEIDNAFEVIDKT